MALDARAGRKGLTHLVDFLVMANIHEEMNELASLLCGYCEAPYNDILGRAMELLEIERTLTISKNAYNQRKAIRLAVDNLLDDIEGLGEA